MQGDGPDETPCDDRNASEKEEGSREGARETAPHVIGGDLVVASLGLGAQGDDERDLPARSAHATSLSPRRTVIKTSSPAYS